MKKSSSGLGVGLWVVGGLVAVYVLGGVIYFLDDEVFETSWISYLPLEIHQAIVWAYNPVHDPLRKVGLLPPERPIIPQKGAR